ncbi:MAG: hypothetical protein KY476_22960 [Planctomycetes bacterium]|nr:hypothetical protein [Planctomycetota bacterium]
MSEIAEPKTETEHVKEALRLGREAAATYEIRHQDADAGECRLHPEPILQWSNPVVGEIYGGVFLWTRRGRPELVASIYKWYSPFTHMASEFQSLSTEPFVLVRDGRNVWRPNRGGVEFKPIPEAPPPAETKAARLRQIRLLSRQFTAEETDRENVTRDLRLLTQPVYRYEPMDPDVIDGAIFAFVLGTDPELLLLIEARRTEDGMRWHYAAARLNSVRLGLMHSGREAWSVETLPWSVVGDRTETYTTIRRK